MDLLRELLLRADTLYKGGQLQEAAKLYHDIVCLKPDCYQAVAALGGILSMGGQHGIAIPLLEYAASKNPNDADTWNNLGVALRQEAHHELASKCYEKAAKLDPNNAMTFANWAGCYVNTGNPDKCLELSKKAYALDPTHPEAGHHMAFGYLEQGDYENGWDWYESRRNIKKFCNRPFRCTEWDGKSGVDVLAIHGEQGCGDEILFGSIFDEVKKYAKHVVIECTPKLKRIFERSFAVPCYSSYDELIQYEAPDAWVPMGTLPKYFRRKPEDFPKNRGENVGYIYPDGDLTASYADMLPKDGRPVVGLAWMGGTKETHWESRTVYLEFWNELLKADVNFVSLQYNDMAGLENIPPLIRRLPHHNEVDELCAMASACDLVITVDQTLVHQCGAMGVPCWVLTPSKPSWRYKISGDMDWYSSVKLYRQFGEDWGTVLKNIMKDLEVFIAHFRKLQVAKPAVA